MAGVGEGWGGCRGHGVVGRPCPESRPEIITGDASGRQRPRARIMFVSKAAGKNCWAASWRDVGELLSTYKYCALLARFTQLQPVTPPARPGLNYKNMKGLFPWTYCAHDKLQYFYW